MRKITDYKEVSPVILKYFKRGVITNNFLGSDSLKAEIEEGNLFFQENEKYLNIYVKRDGFYILYFYALEEDVIFEDIHEKVVSEASGKGEDILKNNGFSPYLTRVRLKTTIASKKESSLAEKADEAQIRESYQLLKSSFDCISGWVPTIEEFSMECGRGLIYSIKEDNENVACLRCGISGNTVQIKHLAVAEKSRGKGYARQLLYAMFEMYNGKKCTVWTGMENRAALGLYKSLGFLEDGEKSTVYMKG